MTIQTKTNNPAAYFDFRSALHKNRLSGLWKMMVDYRLPYAGAVFTLAISAVAKTATFLLLRYFVDNVLTETKLAQVADINRSLVYIALGFVSLAMFEGGFAYL